jgi:hypothetical protein
MAETETAQREEAREQQPTVIICEGCGKAVNPLTLTCGCFHG